MTFTASRSRKTTHRNIRAVTSANATIAAHSQPRGGFAGKVWSRLRHNVPAATSEPMPSEVLAMSGFNPPDANASATASSDEALTA